MDLPSPSAMKRELFLSDRASRFIEASRKRATDILLGNGPRIACIVGPCSIHDVTSALEYARRLKLLSLEIESSFFLVMRVFCEKPRTRSGWKGLIYDPDLDGTCDLAKGLRLARSLFLALANEEIPAATEFLDPLIAPYFDDLITWGFIGARTSASQPHRQLASSLPFPVGFKNNVYGEIGAALNGIQSARSPHVFFGIKETGSIAALRSKGNPWTHLVLRGSESKPNFDAGSIASAKRDLERLSLEPRLVVDCSHGNSAKDHKRQGAVFQDLIAQIEKGSRSIAGVMLESNLVAGSQRPCDLADLSYGLSITDPCIGWEETEELLFRSALSRTDAASSR